ncbi:MAG: hypothetical protein KDI33_16030 [Halioglobus sp.]|nr:hypothetical protein [Halioglobus sp.]
MDDIDKRIRRSALRLIAISIAVGFMLGFAVGAMVVYHSVDQVIVVPLTQGIEV